MGTLKGGTTSAPSTNDIRATSAPSTDYIYLSISFCMRHSIMLCDQNDFHSLFRVKSNNNRDRRNLVTMKQYFNLLKMLSCNRKL